ncbi:MAG: twin-arginine translocase TatA/TatE family subunit [Acidimicrobiaceae bacterium]|nr:twin-arginine translocase TatA/TatE family subunit [Acidimicrobiaceae bacterium]
MVIANLFGPDLGYVVIIVLVVMVGGSQLPKIARNIGTAGKEFRKAQREAEEENAEHEQAPAAVPPAPRAVPAASSTAGQEEVSPPSEQRDTVDAGFQAGDAGRRTDSVD